MIFRLQYCNDSGDTAMIDIETKIGVGVQEIEGSGNPFSLQYKTEKTDKSGRFMTSNADIEIYENEFFNIDILKTSNETDIKVSYYVNEVLEWQGFILPDFFSKEIKDNAVISMTATDRVSTLKSVTLDNLDESIRLREVAKLCLDKTGLILPLLTLADFINDEGSPLFNTYIQSQRLNDEKGRSISCYDILESILISSNAQLVQRKGAWQIINKYQLEQGVGKNYSTLSVFNNWSKTIHNFEFIGKGAIRTITPVASSVGVFQEYGGGKRYPDNYDFDEVGGWTAKNGFNFQRDNREIKWFEKDGDDVIPIWGAVTNQYYLFNKNSIAVSEPTDLIGSPYLESTKTNVPLTNQTAEINIDVNGTSPLIPFTDLPYNQQVALNYVVIAESDTSTLVLNNKGVFVPLENNKDNFQRLSFQRTVADVYSTVTKSSSVKGILDIGLYGNVSNYKISVRIYGSGLKVPILVNYISYTFKSTQDSPKGTLYKTTQGTNFTKEHDVETTVFGDYLTKGVNGYFYDYQNDDTSSLIKSNNDKTNLWTAPNETESFPLLQQISRQKARQFSIAHDIVRGDIKMKSFDPLTIFKDCNNYEYVVVSAEFDFLRSIASIEIEQILYDSNISRRDYIYSYFGEGESSIKSVGGISGGSGGAGGGGGMTSSQLEMLTNLADWWRLDEENDAIYSLKSVYSLKGVSALGLGSGGGGGGGDFDRLDAWVDYNETKANWVLSALLGYDLHTRVNSLEASGGSSNIDIAINGSGNAVTGVSISGNTLTFAKSSIFALSTHTHTIANITGLQDALDGKSATSHTHTFASLTSKPTTLAGYGITALDVKNTAGLNSDTLALGIGSVADGSNSVAIGFNSKTYGSGSLSILSFLVGVDSVAIKGYLEGDSSTVVNGVVEGYYSIGVGSDVYGDNSVSIGGYVEADYSVAIGVDAICEEPNTGVLGTKGVNGRGANKWIIPGNLAIGKDTSATEALDVNGVIKATGGNSTNWNDAYENKHTHGNKALLDLISQSNIDVLNLLSVVDGNIKVDTTLWATGGISALGLGDGGGSGGGGVDMLDAWANYTTAKANYYVPSSLLVPFRSDTLSRLSSIESGSASAIATTGAGNAITSVSKVGNLLTFNKGLEFSLSTHTHTIAQVTGLQGALDGKQPTISTGVTSQYFRGDKTWQTLNTSVVSEGTNLYFTNARVKAYGDTLYSLLGHTHTIAQITGLQGALNLKASQSDITTAINGIEIGGRNYVRESILTNLSTYLSSQISYEWVDFEEASNTTSIRIKGNAGNSAIVGWMAFNILGLNDGDIVSAKYTIKNNATTPIDISTRLQVGNINMTLQPEEVYYFEREGFPLSKNRIQFTLQDIGDELDVLLGGFIINKGTIATDWTPAPEDQVSDWSTTDEASFSYIKNKPTQLSQFTDNIGVATHIANKSNPHAVTKAQVGLKNVDNTSDLLKPISNAVQTALNLKAPLANPTFTGNVTAPTFIGALTGNATSATNLSRSILAGNGLTGGGVLNEDRTLTLDTPSTLTISTTNAVTTTSHTHAITTTTVGAVNTIVATDASGAVRGNIIRIGGNWTLELSGTELVFKYQNVIKQRMLSDGTILATGGLTALSTE